MKRIMLFVFSTINFVATAQEPIWVNNSEINEVKLYQIGAMVTRSGKVTLNPGIQEVVFDGLSPYINPQSISLKGNGDATILSVSYQQDYLKNKKKSKEVMKLEELLDSLTYRLQEIQNKSATLNELQAVLQANKSIGGATNGVLADELELVVEYYAKKSGNIKQDLLENSIKEKKQREMIEKVKQQLGQLNIMKEQPTGNIIVSVDAKTKNNASFEFSYVIGSNASWYTFYDLRAKDVNSPVELVYKAKVNQNTGEDWNKVKLKLNTGNPSIGGLKPELNPWYLNIWEPQPMYKTQGMERSAAPQVMGVIKDQMVLKQENVAMNSIAIQVNQNQLSSEFEIMAPYSIPSDGKEYQVEIQRYSIDAKYSYVAIPKLDADAFLTAKISGWENLSLTPGSANVYFDGAYVGETYLNPAETNDTLEISLGRDKRIVIKREKLKDYSGNKLFGGTRERSFTFEISVKNGKKEAINITIEDQLPVSNDKLIEVKPGENSGAEYNSTTGEIKWRMLVQPNETQKKTLSFSVKYPKDKQIGGL